MKGMDARRRRQLVAARAQTARERDFRDMAYGELEDMLAAEGGAGARARRYFDDTIGKEVAAAFKSLLPPSLGRVTESLAAHLAQIKGMRRLVRAGKRALRADMLAAVRAVGDASRTARAAFRRILRHTGVALTAELRRQLTTASLPPIDPPPPRGVEIVTTLLAAPHGPTAALPAAA
jgi:hypothetical protein